jgi:hypothetical protein
VRTESTAAASLSPDGLADAAPKKTKARAAAVVLGKPRRFGDEEDLDIFHFSSVER